MTWASDPAEARVIAPDFMNVRRVRVMVRGTLRRTKRDACNPRAKSRRRSRSLGDEEATAYASWMVDECVARRRTARAARPLGMLVVAAVTHLGCSSGETPSPAAGGTGTGGAAGHATTGGSGAGGSAGSASGGVSGSAVT